MDETWHLSAMISHGIRAQVQAAPRSLVRVFSISFVALLTGVSAWLIIPLPFTPVPITLQTMVVLGGAVWLGRDGFYAQILYLLLGGLGLPFFSGETSSFQYLLGANGGYLLGFVLAAWAASSWLHPTWSSLSWISRLVRVLAVSLLIFVPGVLQLKWVTGVSMSQALTMGFLPFILGDVLKCGLLSAAPRFRRR